VIRVGVRVARERAELVAAELLVLSPGGLEERELEGGLVELAIYGAAGELPELGEVRAAIGDALVDVVTTEVPDDWEERWRRWHRSLDVGPLRVRPPWEEPRAGALDIVIDPGQAFGTGAHPSTRLTLALLVDLAGRDSADGSPRGETARGEGASRGGPLADWGCGSGVLAVAAAKLGFVPVRACDHEAPAVEATRAAAERNGVAIEVSRCDLRRAPGPWAPTVTANLVRPLLLEIAAAMERPPERLLASGLEVGEVDEVAAAFARHGFALAARRDGDGWSAILLER
jgi:ribosomal protein L11 methyltransferase